MNYNLEFDFDRKVVLFYDADYVNTFGGSGQFVSEYYIDTLWRDKDILEECGLNLYGGVLKWRLTGDEMKDVFKIIDDAIEMRYEYEMENKS